MIYKAKEFILKDGSKVTFKSPSESDAPNLLDSIVKCATSTDYLLSSKEDFDKFYKDITLEEKFISSFNNGDSILIAIYDKDKIIGNASLRVGTHEKDRHRSTIGIAIEKEYRNKGIGSYMFNELINIAKKINSLEQIELEVVSINEHAKHLYTSKGFIKTGVYPHRFKLKDGTYLDSDIMVLFLK